MDTNTSATTRQNHKGTELEKFQLFYEMVPVQNASNRLKRSHANAK